MFPADEPFSLDLMGVVELCWLSIYLVSVLVTPGELMRDGIELVSVFGAEFPLLLQILQDVETFLVH
jgi:hypothetical protein